jgi:hypothetical protein
LGILSATDLRVTAGWGRQDSQGRVNPGKGLVKEREYTAAEADAIRRGGKELGIDEARAFELLGPPPRCVSQRYNVLVLRSNSCLGVFHRRVSGNEKMAFLSGGNYSRLTSKERRGPRTHWNGSTSDSPCAFDGQVER